jgi:hypothetical protein
VTDSESPENQFDLSDPQWFAAGASKAATARARAKLSESEKLELADREADISLKRARVREANSRAAMEPERQRMSLKERQTRLWILIGMAIFAPAYLVAVLLLTPDMIPATGIWAGITTAFALLWRGTRPAPA